MSYEVRSELVQGSTPKPFRDGGRLHYFVRIFLSADGGDSLNEVKLVRYQLHKSFKDRYPTINDRKTEFEVRVWTYGFFHIFGDITLWDGSRRTAEGTVQWRESSAAS